MENATHDNAKKGEGAYFLALTVVYTTYTSMFIRVCDYCHRILPTGRFWKSFSQEGRKLVTCSSTENRSIIGGDKGWMT